MGGAETRIQVGCSPSTKPVHHKVKGLLGNNLGPVGSFFRCTL